MLPTVGMVMRMWLGVTKEDLGVVKVDISKNNVYRHGADLWARRADQLGSTVVNE